MHVLVHFAKSDIASIKLAENAKFEGIVSILEPRYRKHVESGTLRLIRTAFKAFAFGGDVVIQGFLYG